MDEILDLAAQLGKGIAATARFKALRAAEGAIEADAEARQLLKEADAQKARLADLAARGQPIEPEDKREMERLNEGLSGNEKLHALVRAQADYLELMNKVNEAIRRQLT